MDLQTSIDLLKQRVSWPEMRAILKNAELPSALGWDKTVKKLHEHLSNQADQDLASQALYDAYKETLSYGTKIIWLFKMDKDQMTAIFDRLCKSNIDNSLYCKTFPQPLAKSELQQQSVMPELVQVEAFNTRCNLIYCSKRHYSVREEIDVAKLGSVQQKAFGGFDSLIGLRSEICQGFDVLSFHRDSGLVEVRADLIVGVTWDDNIMFLGHLLSELRRRTRELLHPTEVNLEQVNFFPLLQKLYDDYDGRVVEIGHDTGGTGGIIREKMRRKSLDVREEDFHKAGISATTIELFEIAKIWPVVGAAGDFEIYVPGSIRLLSELYPKIFETIVKGCVSEEHYRQAFQKITSHI